MVFDCCFCCVCLGHYPGKLLVFVVVRVGGGFLTTQRFLLFNYNS